jgi:hypothetical protein
LVLAINSEEIDSCGWSNGLIVHCVLSSRPGSDEESNFSKPSIEFLGALLAE